ncbi:MAG: hypothetical protein ABW196_02810 [Solirubrobacterales bacterium]
MTMNGCDYAVKIGQTTGGGETYGATTDMVCPAGKHIQVEVFLSQAESAKYCTFTIKPQTGLTGLHAAISAGDLLITGTVSGLHVEQSGACGSSTSLGTQMDIGATFEGLNTAGAPTGLSISDQESSGKLTSDGPVTLQSLDGTVVLQGSQTGGKGSNMLSVFESEVECGNVTYTGNRLNKLPYPSLPAGATTVTLSAQYVECSTRNKEGALPATVNMNGCDYVLHFGSTTAKDTYTSTTDIVCPTGKVVQIEAFSAHPEGVRVCTLSIKAQAGFTGLHMTSTTSPGHIDVSGTVKGIHVEKSLGLCEAKTSAEGSAALDITFKGEDTGGGFTPIGVVH